MLKINHIVFTCIALTIISCQNIDCPKQEELIESFEEKMHNVENINPKVGIGGQDYVDITIMHMLTGIPSSVSYGDISVYNSEQDKQDDVASWNRWFTSNKCSLSTDTLQKLDSLILSNNSWIFVE